MNETYDLKQSGENIAKLLAAVEDGTVVKKYTDKALDANSEKPIANGIVTEALSKKIDEAEADKRYMKQSQIPETSDGYWYGVEWDTDVASTAMTRIGNMELHRTLPVQNGMRGCLLDDDGNVVAYLPRSSWKSATLDGSKGQVMVEIPEHYRKFEEDGAIRRCKISTYPYAGYHRVPKMYISAYEATVQRSTNKLCSVVNTDADYRGGKNNSAWDGTYRTLLGRPATGISRASFRNYARNRNGAATAEWNCQTYEAYKAVFWLYYVEYANRNCQLTFNAEKDSNGYAQGGLGRGITTAAKTDWSEYNGSQPIAPCGHTDELGNGSGQVAYEALKADGSVWATLYANRYRGIENPFGHIWKWADGINIKVSPTKENGGDNTSKVYVADNPANYKEGYDGYAVQGLEARTEGYVTQLVFGEHGDITPAVVLGGATIYWADHHFPNIPSAETLRGVILGGSVSSNLLAGFCSRQSNFPPSYSQSDIGSRLCFIPNNNK